MGELHSHPRGRCERLAADAAPSAEHGRPRPSLLAPAISVLYSRLGSFSDPTCAIKRKRRKKHLQPRGDDVGFLTSTVLCRVLNTGVKPRCSGKVFDTLWRAMAEKFTAATSRHPLPEVSGGRTLGWTDPWPEGVTDGRATASEPL